MTTEKGMSYRLISHFTIEDPLCMECQDCGMATQEESDRRLDQFREIVVENARVVAEALGLGYVDVDTCWERVKGGD